jgi:hypothetical protein
MNRQQAKELPPIIQAFAEGKTIQVQEDINWCYLGNNADFNLSPQRYRIKTEPKYRPFENKEECWQEMLKHQPFGWTKSISEKRFYFISKLMIMAASFQIMTIFHSKLFLHQTRLLTEHHSV